MKQATIIFKRTVALLMAQVIIISGLFAPMNALADLSPSSLFNGITATGVSGGEQKAQARSIYSLGGGSIRTQQTSLSLMSVQSPSFSAGCNGIDWHFGGFSFISSAEIEKMVQSIAQSAVGVVIDLAMNVLCPQCYAVMNTMRDMSNKIRQDMQDSCSLAKAGVGAIWSGMGGGKYDEDASKKTCAQTKTKTNGTDTYAQGVLKIDLCGGLKSLSDDLKAAYVKIKGGPDAAGETADQEYYGTLGNVTFQTLEAMGFLAGQPSTSILLSVLGMHVYHKGKDQPCTSAVAEITQPAALAASVASTADAAAKAAAAKTTASATTAAATADAAAKAAAVTAAQAAAAINRAAADAASADATKTAAAKAAAEAAASSSGKSANTAAQEAVKANEAVNSAIKGGEDASKLVLDTERQKTDAESLQAQATAIGAAIAAATSPPKVEVTHCHYKPLISDMARVANALICGFKPKSDAALFAARAKHWGLAVELGDQITTTCANKKTAASDNAFDGGDDERNWQVWHCPSVSTDKSGKCLSPERKQLNKVIEDAKPLTAAGAPPGRPAYTGLAWLIVDALLEGVYDIKEGGSSTGYVAGKNSAAKLWVKIIENSDYPLYRVLNFAAVYPEQAAGILSAYGVTIAAQHVISALELLVQQSPAIQLKDLAKSTDASAITNTRAAISGQLRIAGEYKDKALKTLGEKQALVEFIVQLNKTLQQDVMSSGLMGNGNLAVSIKKHMQGAQTKKDAAAAARAAARTPAAATTP